MKLKVSCRKSVSKTCSMTSFTITLLITCIWIVAIAVEKTRWRITRRRGLQVVGSVYFWTDQALYTSLNSVHLVMQLCNDSLGKKKKKSSWCSLFSFSQCSISYLDNYVTSSNFYECVCVCVCVCVCARVCVCTPICPELCVRVQFAAFLLHSFTGFLVPLQYWLH